MQTLYFFFFFSATQEPSVATRSGGIVYVLQILTRPLNSKPVCLMRRRRAWWGTRRLHLAASGRWSGSGCCWVSVTCTFFQTLRSELNLGLFLSLHLETYATSAVRRHHEAVTQRANIEGVSKASLWTILCQHHVFSQPRNIVSKQHTREVFWKEHLNRVRR